MLTQDRLRELLVYDPLSGEFTWLVNRLGSGGAGSRAGAFDGQGYRQIGIDGRIYREHRLVWLYVHGHWPVADLDHINRNRSDSRLANLRPATRSQNSANSGPPRNNSSGFKGVSLEKRSGRWHAYITVARRRQNLGRFDTAEAANAAYVAAAVRIHGEFARAA